MTDLRRTLAELDRLLDLRAGVQSFTYPPAPREPDRVPAVLVERIARAGEGRVER